MKGRSKTLPLTGLFVALLLCASVHAHQPATGGGQVATVLPNSPSIVGTVFAGDQAMLDRQCEGDPDACGKFFNRAWSPERVEFSRNGMHLLVSMCRRLDITRCTLKRYLIDENRWEDLPGLPQNRSYTDAQYSPDGKTIVAVSWRCLDLPWQPPAYRHPSLPPAQPPLEPVCAMHEPNLWLLKADGEPQRLLLPGRFILSIVNTAGTATGDQRTKTPGAVVRWPVWSADGRHLLYWRALGSFSRNTGLATGFWHLHELDLGVEDTQAERQLDNALWAGPSGVPVYHEDGNRVVASVRTIVQLNYDVFDIDLGEPLPVKKPQKFFPGDPMPVFTIDKTGEGLFTTTGGSNLYRANLRGDRTDDYLKSKSASTKMWQSRGSGGVIVHATVTPDWRHMALIEGLRQPGADEFRVHRLWLRLPDLSVRHIRLPE